ncbi:SRPBCC domain-containing protein [Lusitaniella coriacea LEGE 07157]|uniref:SRPBCC domain-containing protein n=1 Tax=Lusitaniella coriacea LEGE 07157 TaxID=945747 RepID=A0A8J7DV72_9CYAN|nr:SRPBCC domain-containing protein [Lusitaniella coriacea]MBE9115596.1 SRPBCC domain-containing protein [Lusitaniella coriacea LEGE 07157]
MQQRVNLDVVYSHPPDRVWRAIANRQGLAAWLMDNDFEPRLGHRFRFQTQPLPGWKREIDCEVIELDEPKRLAYTWRETATSQPSIVTWILEPVEGGTRVRLEHRAMAATFALATSLLSPSSPNPFSQRWEKESNLSQEVPPPDVQNEWHYRLNSKLPEILAKGVMI